MVYLIGITVFCATRSLEHFWSGILDPLGLLLLDNVTRYWTVVEKNTLLLHWTGVSFSTTVCSGSVVGLVSLIACFALFPMSVEALTASQQGKRAPPKPRRSKQEDPRPKRALVAAELPASIRSSAPLQPGASSSRSRDSAFATSFARFRSGRSSAF